MKKEILEKIAQVKLNKSSLLSLPKCDLESIPKEVFELTHLTNLNLSENNLKTIPSKISKLKNLAVLYLNGNQIDNFQKEYFQDFETYFRKTKIGVVDLVLKTITIDSFKQIPLELSDKYKLKRSKTRNV
ncbi:leucine-rich repeat domain-containing protein [Aureivirga sp. CE67]|uniref:leucine-rich repeat domain-containing protein n=1 Tax=Aureivirga sp. CE67 TaxID=1788983 RepID=UPI0018CAE836|nr:leucine-rich repeat domain-containing protein [Aureivirga sp. CE67]